MSARTSGGGPARVVALLPYPLDTTPSQRFRLEQWAPLLAEQGINLELKPFADAQVMSLLYKPGALLRKTARLVACLARQLADLASLESADVIVVHRAASLIGPPIVERLATRSGTPLIYDFDDAIFRLHSSEANTGFAWLKAPGKTRSLCRLARHVTVANEHLAEFANLHNKNVTIVPSSVDTDQLRPTVKSDLTQPVVLGWTGSSTSQSYLEAFGPTLAKLVTKPGVELHVHSDRRPQLPCPFVWHRWTPENEAEVLARFDIGIMPLPDNEWTRGKSAMKALLCMAMGIPTICSPVGANRNVIQHAHNGFLAETPEEWQIQLHSLVEDPVLRRRVGEAARETVVTRYSHRVCADSFASVVRATLEGPAG